MSDELEWGWPEQLQGLLPHLDELRRRLLVSAGALMVCTLLAFVFAGQVIAILAKPVGGLEGLQAIELTENLGVYMRTALRWARFRRCRCSSTRWWPLYRTGADAERAATALHCPALCCAVVSGWRRFCLFRDAAGGHFVLGEFWWHSDNAATRKTTSDSSPGSFSGFGVAFETPLIIAVLARIGIVTPTQLRKGWRIAVVAIAVLAAHHHTNH